MKIVFSISLTLLDSAAWLMFYADGCPYPMAWVLLGFSIVLAIIASAKDLVHPSPLRFITAMLMLGFQIYTWAKGWPINLVVPLFWLTIVTTLLGILDECLYLSRR